MRGVLAFLFQGWIPTRVYMKSVKIKEKNGVREREQRQRVPEKDDQYSVIALFSWVLSIVLLVCVAGVFVLIIIERPVPDFIPPVITAILGYFGGAVTAYFGLKSGGG